MRRLLLIITLFCWIFAATSVSAQEGDSTPTPLPTPAEFFEQPTLQAAVPSIGISYPSQGETLAGIVPISGTITLPGLTLWELSFSYAENPNDTWFLLKSGTEKLSGELYSWDTRLLTDGDYTLRLRVLFSDASRDILVSPVKVRNYTEDISIPTLLPTATSTLPATATATIEPLETTAPSTPSMRPTPTQLPANPAILENKIIFASLLRGASYTALAFAILGILLYLRQRFSKRS